MPRDVSAQASALSVAVSPARRGCPQLSRLEEIFAKWMDVPGSIIHNPGKSPDGTITGWWRNWQNEHLTQWAVNKENDAEMVLLKDTQCLNKCE